MNDWRCARVGALLATVSTVAMLVEPAAASAQSAPNGYYQNGAPPPGTEGWEGALQGDQYTQAGPPPPEPYAASRQDPYGPSQGRYGAPFQGEYPPADDAGRQVYNPGYYPQYAGGYQAQYAQWAAQNCFVQHRNNTVAGAVIGGVAGVVLGASLAGWAARGAWVLLGGSLGATAGAAIGASSSTGYCPQGYAVRPGAPPPYYGGPAYGPGPAAYYARPAYAPYPSYRRAPYRPWVWAGDRWVYRPHPDEYRRPGYGDPGYRRAPASSQGY